MYIIRNVILIFDTVNYYTKINVIIYGRSKCIFIF